MNISIIKISNTFWKSISPILVHESCPATYERIMGKCFCLKLTPRKARWQGDLADSDLWFAGTQVTPVGHSSHAPIPNPVGNSPLENDSETVDYPGIYYVGRSHFCPSPTFRIKYLGLLLFRFWWWWTLFLLQKSSIL